MYSTGHIDKKEVDQPKPRKQDAAMPTTGEHKSGCPATGGYGHGPEPCICGAGKPMTGEWTVELVEKLLGYSTHIGCKRISDAHNAALAAAIATAVDKERDKWIEINRQHENAWSKELIDTCDKARAAQQPLVDALTKIRKRVVPDDLAAYLMELQDVAAAALANVKEGKI